ncbi:MAG: hypothetical protein HPY61_12655 [Methanotrichaceae archaeon]|nr:hypothetical protein [Methanotrichaceae archaeon]
MHTFVFQLEYQVVVVAVVVPDHRGQGDRAVGSGASAFEELLRGLLQIRRKIDLNWNVDRPALQG